MNGIITLIRKEFARFFKDPRLFITTVFLPGILIFGIYSLIGSITASLADTSYLPVAYVYNMPQSQQLSAPLNAALKIEERQIPEEEAIDLVKKGKADVAVIFPQDFEEKIASAGESVPNVKIYYNSSEESSVAGYSIVSGILSSYEQSLSNLFDVNAGGEKYDLAESTGTAMKVLSMIVPMILLMMLFSGCIAVVLESVAGEKERGTIATLLVTPVKRSHIAIGKIAALSVMAMMSGLSSFLGIIFSLPKIISGVSGISFSLYGALDYFAVFGVIISTVLILVSLLAIVSAYAKSVKEANALMVPVMVLVMVCAMVSMFLPSHGIGLFFIPLLNSALCITSVMSGAVTAATFVVTVCVNLAFAAALVFVLTLMFKSERIMFNR